MRNISFEQFSEDYKKSVIAFNQETRAVWLGEQQSEECEYKNHLRSFRHPGYSLPQSHRIRSDIEQIDQKYEQSFAEVSRAISSVQARNRKNEETLRFHLHKSPSDSKKYSAQPGAVDQTEQDLRKKLATSSNELRTLEKNFNEIQAKREEDLKQILSAESYYEEYFNPVFQQLEAKGLTSFVLPIFNWINQHLSWLFQDPKCSPLRKNFFENVFKFLNKSLLEEKYMLPKEGRIISSDSPEYLNTEYSGLKRFQIKICAISLLKVADEAVFSKIVAEMVKYPDEVEESLLEESLLKPDDLTNNNQFKDFLLFRLTNAFGSLSIFNSVKMIDAYVFMGHVTKNLSRRRLMRAYQFKSKKFLVPRPKYQYTICANFSEFQYAVQCDSEGEKQKTSDYILLNVSDDIQRPSWCFWALTTDNVYQCYVKDDVMLAACQPLWDQVPSHQRLNRSKEAFFVNCAGLDQSWYSKENQLLSDWDCQLFGLLIPKLVKERRSKKLELSAFVDVPLEVLQRRALDYFNPASHSPRNFTPLIAAFPYSAFKSQQILEDYCRRSNDVSVFSDREHWFTGEYHFIWSSHFTEKFCQFLLPNLMKTVSDVDHYTACWEDRVLNVVDNTNVYFKPAFQPGHHIDKRNVFSHDALLSQGSSSSEKFYQQLAHALYLFNKSVLCIELEMFFSQVDILKNLRFLLIMLTDANPHLKAVYYYQENSTLRCKDQWPVSNGTMTNDPHFILKWMDVVAARNRVLALDQTSMDEKSAEEMWKQVSAQWGSLLLSAREPVTSESVNSYLQFKNTWLASACPLEAYSEATTLDYQYWVYLQLSQMGALGVVWFFDELKRNGGRYQQPFNKRQDLEPSASPELFFDLSGNRLESPEIYTEAVCKGLISLLDSKQKKVHHTPRFGGINLVLPKHMTTAIVDSLLELFKAFPMPSATPDSEPGTVTLHTLTQAESGWLCKAEKNNRVSLGRFLQMCRAHAESDHNATVHIVIPELEETYQFNDTDFAHLQKDYVLLQNTINNNRRLSRQEKLLANTKHLVQFSKDPKNINFAISDSDLSEDEAWQWQSGFFNLPALNTGNLSIQYQHQQQQQRQQQQQQEQEQEQEAEQIIEQESCSIHPFTDREPKVVTRETIAQDHNDDYCELWIKNNCSGNQADLKTALVEFFNAVVGSDKDAPNSITEIGLGAINRMCAYPEYFLMGVSAFDLPAGFYLTPAEGGTGWALCFSEKKEYQKMRARATQERVNTPAYPFTVKIRLPAQNVVPWSGDHTQILPSAVPGNEALALAQLAFWRELAVLCDPDSIKAKKLAQWFRSENPTLSSVEQGRAVVQAMASLHQVSDSLYPSNPSSEAQEHTVREQLFAWLTEYQKDSIFSLDEEFIRGLLLSNAPIGFSKANLRALAAIIYHYEHLETKSAPEQSAFLRFFYLCQTVHRHFGEQYFGLWRQFFLDRSDNFVELLSRRQVTAMLESINTLRQLQEIEGDPGYTKIWWALIEKHCSSTRHDRYSKLWKAYQNLIHYISSKNLKLDFNVIKKLLEKSENFNLLIFAERLYACLRTIEQSIYTVHNQRYLLQHLDSVDWRSSGLLYAMQHSGYLFYHKSLQLSEFSYSNFSTPYKPQLDPIINAEVSSEHWPVQIYRFMALKSTYLESDISDMEALLQFVSDRVTCSLQHQANLGKLMFVFYSITQVDLRVLKEQLGKCPSDFLFSSNYVAFIAHVAKSFSLELGGIPKLYFSFDALNTIFTLLENTENLQEFLAKDAVSVLALLNKLGIVLSYFQHKNTSAQNHIASTEAALKNCLVNSIALEDPLLPCYVWSADQGNANYAASFDKMAIGSSDEISCFLKQLDSINFSASKAGALPNITEVVACLLRMRGIVDSPESERIAFIDHYVGQGVVFTINNDNFQKLDDQSIAEFIKKLSLSLRPVYASYNERLCRKLLEKKLALPTDAVSRQLSLFAVILKRIDNKEYFNDLGHALGALLETTPENLILSLPQVIHLLETLLPENPKDHYPVDLLEAILRGEANDPSSTLANARTAMLSESPNPLLQARIPNLIKDSDISGEVKADLVTLIYLRPGFVYQSQESRLTWAAYEAIEKKVKTRQVADAMFKISNRDVISSIVTFVRTIVNKPQVMESSEDYLIKLIKNIAQLFQKLREESSPEFVFVVEHILYTRLTQFMEMDHNNFMYLPLLVSQLGRFALDSKLRQIALIAIIACETKRPISEFPEYLSRVLSRLEEGDKIEQILALLPYYHSKPYPNANFLLEASQDALPDYSETEYSGLQDYFERYYQAHTYDKGAAKTKRNYSLEKSDEDSLLRVLAYKKKKNNYAYDSDQTQKAAYLELVKLNAFSLSEQLHSMKAKTLYEALYQVIKRIKDLSNCTPAERKRLNIQLLAYIRELFLRMTGKWANHTQLLVLLNTIQNQVSGEDALKNLRYQVKTGEGKSIITCLWAVYFALTGNTVDICTSKESLSWRDFHEFSPVFKGFGIKTAYIRSSSPPGTYLQNTDRDSVGCVNYGTPGNIALHLSHCVWAGKAQENWFSQKDRLVILDEGDEIQTHDDTGFNYAVSNNDQNSVIYNLDEWAYIVVYKFYLAHKHLFEGSRISRDGVLPDLYNELKARIHTAPEDSPIKVLLQKKISQSAPDCAAQIEKRELQLYKLLRAAHIASSLRGNDVDFSLGYQYVQIAKGLKVKTGIAYVVIRNKIAEGSSYSELVQQFLCVRLNNEAVEKGNAPNFRVDPVTRVALSDNAKRMFGQASRYERQLSCTGTAGDAHEIAASGVTVIKFPSHKLSQNTGYEDQYVEGHEAHIAALAEEIVANQDRPILVSYEDDDEVKLFSEEIAKYLQTHKNEYWQAHRQYWVVDTQSSGDENAQASGVKTKEIIHSARMSRGTHLEVKADAGMHVLFPRRYYASAQKQRSGRTARNGAKGSNRLIINIAAVKEEIEAIQKGAYADFFKRLYEYEEKHFYQKMNRHHKEGSKKYVYFLQSTVSLEEDIESSHLKEPLVTNHLQTRTLAHYRYLIKNYHARYELVKERMIADFSSIMKEHLLKKVPNPMLVKNLKEDFQNFREKFDDLWQKRDSFKAQEAEGHEISALMEQNFKQFIIDTLAAWSDLIDRHHLNESIPSVNEYYVVAEDFFNNILERLSSADQERLQEETHQVPHRQDYVKFHRIWKTQMIRYYWGNDAQKPLFSPIAKNHAFPDAGEVFLNAIFKLSQQDSLSVEQKHQIFTTLSDMANVPGFYIFKEASLGVLLDSLVTIANQKGGGEHLNTCLNSCSQILNDPRLIEGSKVVLQFRENLQVIECLALNDALMNNFALVFKTASAESSLFNADGLTNLLLMIIQLSDVVHYRNSFLNDRFKQCLALLFNDKPYLLSIFSNHFAFDNFNGVIQSLLRFKDADYEILSARLEAYELFLKKYSSEIPPENFFALLMAFINNLSMDSSLNLQSQSVLYSQLLPNSFDSFDSVAYRDYCRFLSARPFTITQLKQLNTLLSKDYFFGEKTLSNYRSESNCLAVRKRVYQLSAWVPMEAILFVLDHQNPRELSNRLFEIFDAYDEAAQHFNQFLVTYNLLPSQSALLSEEDLSSPAPDLLVMTKDLYHRLIAQRDKEGLRRCSVFFDKITKAEPAIDWLPDLLAAYADGKLSDAHLNDALVLIGQCESGYNRYIPTYASVFATVDDLVKNLVCSNQLSLKLPISLQWLPQPLLVKYIKTEIMKVLVQSRLPVTSELILSVLQQGGFQSVDDVIKAVHTHIDTANALNQAFTRAFGLLKSTSNVYAGVASPDDAAAAAADSLASFERLYEESDSLFKNRSRALAFYHCLLGANVIGELPTKVINNLHDYYLQNETVTTEQLARLLKLALKLFRLVRSGPTAMHRFWLSDAPQDKVDRIECLRFLAFDYFNFADNGEFSIAQILQSYTNLTLEKIVSPDAFSLNQSRVKTIAATQDALSAVARHCEEVVQAGRPMTQNSNDGSPDSNIFLRADSDQSFSTLRGFFQEKKKQYDKMWWVAKDRRQVADSLFCGLGNSDQEPFSYKDMLDQVLSAQEELINADNRSVWQRNRCGYSRLMDITNQLLLKISEYCLKDKSSVQEDRYVIQASMAKSFVINLKMLHQRWGSKNKAFMDCLKPSQQNGYTLFCTTPSALSLPLIDTTSMDSPLPEDALAKIQHCSTALSKLQPSQVPKHLWYLYDNVRVYGEILRQAHNNRVEQSSLRAS